jgi:WhiB family redox-sensing transcriptional regulator
MGRAAHRESRLPLLPPRFVLSGERAACRDVDPEVFFPAQGESGDQARAVCRPCPLRAACGAWALGQTDELVGVWGGLSARERRRLKRELR